MRLNLRRQISAFLISVLVMMSAAPHLTVAAAVSDQEGQEMTEDVLIGDNGTRYDSDYDPYIWDEEVEYYDEDSEEYSNFVRDYYGQDGVFTTVDGRQISLASASNLASPSNLASLSDWVEMGELASPSNLASPSDVFENIEAVSFTDAGPFLRTMASLQSRYKGRRMARSFSGNDPQNDAIKLSKSVEPTGEGKYQITLEAYTTGNVISTTEALPVDVVLVLDVSGSMKEKIDVANKYDEESIRLLDTKYGGKEGIYSYEGSLAFIKFEHPMRYSGGKWEYKNEGILGTRWHDLEDSWFSNTIRISKLNALKIATKRFVDSVEKKAGEDGVEHRISVVSFGDGANEVIGLTNVETDGEKIKSKIDSLSSNGPTRADLGMRKAKEILNNSNSNRNSNQVVILFTDGEPNSYTGFDIDIANSAIKTSKDMKNNDITVYSIGVFANADGSPTDNITTNMNKYMHYVSSNFKNAESMTNPGEATYPSDGSSYYLTTAVASEINDIFQSISDKISSPNIDLDTSVKIKDVMSDYFVFSGSRENVVVTTEKAYYDGSDLKWKNSEVLTDISISSKENEVIVEGFDFNHNFVANNPRTEGSDTDFYGRKLVIKFPIKPKDGFLGGNEVPTNDVASSGLLQKEMILKHFELPHTDVPIPDVTVEAAPKNVYLAGVLTDEDYQEGASVKCGDVVILGEGADNLEEWQSAYVDISALTVNRPAEALMGDNKYTLSCTVSPKESGSGSQNGKTGTSGVTDIHVYKPTITFHDGEIFYGESLPEDEHDYDANRYDSKGEEAIVWKHGDTVMTADTIMHGSKPELLFTYEYDASKVNDGTVNTKDALPIKVKAVTAKSQNDSNEQIVTPHVTLEHADCPSVGAGTDEMAAYPGYHFLLHVKTGTLTIKKIVEDGIGDGEPFIFTVKKDNESYTTCTVPGNGEITISELPLGVYTIEEETGKGSLAWRYGTPDYGNTGKQSELTKDNPNLSFSCTNKIDNQKWLSGSARAVNERNAEGEQNTPETTRLSDMKGILGERKEWLGEFADSEASLYGRGMRNKPTGGDR